MVGEYVAGGGDGGAGVWGGRVDVCAVDMRKRWDGDYVYDDHYDTLARRRHEICELHCKKMEMVLLILIA